MDILELTHHSQKATGVSTQNVLEPKVLWGLGKAFPDCIATANMHGECSKVSEIQGQSLWYLSLRHRQVVDT